MPSDDSQSQPPFQPKSSYQPLDKPDFKPAIPAYLIDGMTDQDKFITENLSVLSQYVKWSVDTQMLVHQQVRATNGRLLTVEGEIKKSREELDDLKGQAKVMSPFLKPVSMFASLWTYSIFKWFFVGGIIFFLFVAYPYLLKIGLLDLLDSYFKSH